MAGWGPGLSGKAEGAWHRARGSESVVRLLVDCAVSTLGTGYRPIATKSSGTDFYFESPNFLKPSLNLCLRGDPANVANRNPPCRVNSRSALKNRMAGCGRIKREEGKTL